MRKIFISLIFIFGLILFGLSVKSVYAGACDCSGGNITGDYGCYAYNWDPFLEKMVCYEPVSYSCQEGCCIDYGVGCIVSSFPPGTLIKTPGFGSVKIEELKVGDIVTSFKDNDILDSKIRKIFKYERDFYYSLSAGDYSVKASAEHPFYIGGGEFKVISKLVSGDTVYVLENDKLVSKTVTSNIRIDKSTPVYNLTVDNTNTYFANGFAVHNKGGGPERQGDINCPAGTVVDYNQPIATVCSSQEQGYQMGNAQQITGCCREVTIKGACEWISEWKQGREVLRKECAPDETNCAQNYYTTYACVPICDPNDWGAWGACSASCGPGTQSRTNACGTSQSQSCQVNNPNSWGAWSTCTVNCGTGTQSRTNQCGTSQTQNCNTQVCGPWIKLKDSSFISANNLFNMISSVPDPYDDDDTTDQYFIVGNDGVVAAPVIDLDISNVTPTAKTGNPEYKVLYTPNSDSMTPALFLSYIKARKEYKVITDLGEITGSGIYFIDGDIAISSNAKNLWVKRQFTTCHPTTTENLSSNVFTKRQVFCRHCI